MKKNTKGLNLAELCIGILVLSTVIVMIIGILSGGLIGIKKGEDSIVIGNIIQTELEYYSEEVLYHFSDSNYANGASHSLSKYNNKAIDNVKIKEVKIEFEEKTSGDVRNKLKKITMTVSWYDKNLAGQAGISKRTASSWVSNYLD